MKKMKASKFSFHEAWVVIFFYVTNTNAPIHLCIIYYNNKISIVKLSAESICCLNKLIARQKDITLAKTVNFYFIFTFLLFHFYSSTFICNTNFIMYDFK